jgi:hypothetical protein
MKNLFLIKTDKPSRLFDCFEKLGIGDNTTTREGLQVTNQHLYITNSEEIKEGDWYLYTDILSKLHIRQHLDKGVRKGYDGQKIILTTDPELIKDGVQAIDDIFLEWFVKNPSCEYAHIGFIAHNDIREYKIIIPQEDPNTNLEKLPFPELVEELANYYKEVPLVEEPKQETLEEVAERLFPFTKDDSENRIITIKRLFWIAGAKWQAERSYSEEEVGELVYNIIGQYANQVNIMIDGSIINGLFEQFKKKA